MRWLLVSDKESGMDASADAIARHRPGCAADHLGCRFLYGLRTAGCEDTRVLCEIKVSLVAPFPEQAPKEIGRRAPKGG
jgi:hypothetical protein